MALLLLAVTFAASCGDAATTHPPQPPVPAQAALPPDAAILDGRTVATLLRQCSRATPAPGDGTWQPSPEDVAALEAGLPAALAAAGRSEVRGAPQGWRRQYVGIVRGGRRFIYGNFFPHAVANDYGPSNADRWRREPTLICDGGPAFFGVEYDVAARRFTHLAFNGAV